MIPIIKFRNLSDFQKVLFFEHQIKAFTRLLQLQNKRIIKQQRQINRLRSSIKQNKKCLAGRKSLQKEVKRLEQMVIKSRS